MKLKKHTCTTCGYESGLAVPQVAECQKCGNDTLIVPKEQSPEAMNEKKQAEGFLTQRMCAAIEAFVLDTIRDFIQGRCEAEDKLPEGEQNFVPEDVVHMCNQAIEKLKNQLYSSAKDFTQILMLEMDESVVGKYAEIAFLSPEGEIDSTAMDAIATAHELDYDDDAHMEASYAICNVLSGCDHLRKVLHLNPTTSFYQYHYFGKGHYTEVEDREPYDWSIHNVRFPITTFSQLIDEINSPDDELNN